MEFPPVDEVVSRLSQSGRYRLEDDAMNLERALGRSFSSRALARLWNDSQMIELSEVWDRAVPFDEFLKAHYAGKVLGQLALKSGYEPAQTLAYAQQVMAGYDK